VKQLELGIRAAEASCSPGPTTLTSGLLLPITAEQTEVIGAEVSKGDIDARNMTSEVQILKFQVDCGTAAPVASVALTSTRGENVTGGQVAKTAEVVRFLPGMLAIVTVDAAARRRDRCVGARCRRRLVLALPPNGCQ